ncbi:MAG: hypothetical protein ACI4M5_00515 [Christensenellales bacterium]
MIIFKILVMILGFPLVISGYTLFFRKNTSIVRRLPFMPKDADLVKYAKIMGITQFVAGLLMWLCGLVSLWLGKISSIVVLCVALVGAIASLMITYVYAYKNVK